jgi:hypothetical protein
MPFRTPSEGRKLPDTDRYRNRFQVESDSSNKKYTIAFDIARNAGYWTCSCMGCCTRGQCKHLDRLGYKGRQYGASHPDNKAMLREILGVAEVVTRVRQEREPMRIPSSTPRAFRPIVTAKMLEDTATAMRKAKEEEVPLWTPEDVAEAALEFEAN